jgi:MFS family permease
MTPSTTRSMSARLPFFYGWVVVAVVFITMGVGVNARTAFSLLFPPILDEFGWDRGVTAGAFSFGFIVSAALSPSLGRLMDARGPRLVNEIGVVLIAAGLLLATLVHEPWHLYATLGMLVGGGSVCLGYTGQGLFLPNWFVRRRGLAMSIAFSGVGVGSVIVLPWLQGLIANAGWRSACFALGVLVLVLLLPLNLLVRRRPQDIGLEPDGDRVSPDAAHAGRGMSSTTPGLLSIGHSVERSAPLDSGGSRWAISARCSPGTRCRYTRRNTWWKSASPRTSPPGRSAQSVLQAYRVRSASAIFPTG